VIGPGAARPEPTVTDNVLAPDLPQALLAVTETVPPLAPTTVMIVLVVDVPDQPFGSVHVYDVAPLTAGTEKVSTLPILHPEDLLMVPGVAGALLTTVVNDCAPDVPQLFVADTVITPPAEPVVAMIVLVVEVPVHPLGSVQIYEVAPLTGATVKVSKPPTLQIVARPLILPGIAGAAPTVTASI